MATQLNLNQIEDINVANIQDITATASELNLLDLAGLTSGFVLSADGPSSASWKQLNTSNLNNDLNFIAGISIELNDLLIGTQSTINFTNGDAINLTIVDDSGNNEIDLQIDLQLTGLTTGSTIADDDIFVMYDQSETDLRTINANILQNHIHSNIDIEDVTVTGLTIELSNQSTYSGKLIAVDSTAGATSITLNSDVTIGKQFAVIHEVGANTVSFVAGGGVTIISKDSNLNLAGIGSAATVTKRSATEYFIVGDLSA